MFQRLGFAVAGEWFALRLTFGFVDADAEVVDYEDYH